MREMVRVRHGDGVDGRRGVGDAMWCALLALLVMLALSPSSARAAGCPDANADTSYTGNCGPAIAVPSWTDAGGWTDPSQYSTIRLADVNGDGHDELLGRNQDGLEVYWFDTSVGQWRPQVDANNVRQLVSAQDANGNMVSDFASPTISNESDPHRITGAQYYSTIQAADIDGQAGEEVVARFWDGMRVYKYVPPAGGNKIDGGTWKRIGTGGPFSDATGGRTHRCTRRSRPRIPTVTQKRSWCHARQRARPSTGGRVRAGLPTGRR